MPECKGEIITNLNISGILKEFSVNNMANNDEGFLKEMLNILANRSSPLMQLELQKTYLVVLQWYKSTIRRIQDLQPSVGIPVTAANQPWQVLWKSTSSLRDFECFCSRLINRPCKENIMRRLYLMLSRDKIAFRTDLKLILNLNTHIEKDMAKEYGQRRK